MLDRAAFFTATLACVGVAPAATESRGGAAYACRLSQPRFRSSLILEISVTSRLR